MERLSFRDEIRNNKIKSFFLLVGIIAVFIILGYLIGRVNPGYFFVIMIAAIILSLSYVWFGYYNSDKIALASVHAIKANKTEHSALINAVESMSIASGLPMPRVYVMNSEQINAFASGRNPKNAVICVTTGAMKKLNKTELEGVVAHEMSHIANYDIRFITIATVLVGLISIVGEIFLRSLWFQGGNRDDKNGALVMIAAVLIAVLAPIIANLISLAISRKREFAADATGVKFTRYPIGLRNALIKIKNEHISDNDKKKYVKTMAPLFISNPFNARQINSLFSTHPDINDRIAKLEKM